MHPRKMYSYTPPNYLTETELLTLRDTADTVDSLRRSRGGMSPVVVVSGVAVATLQIFCFRLVALSKLPTARFRSGPRNDEFFRRGVSTVVCRCLLQIRVPKGKASDTQIEPKRQPPKSKWSQKGSKTSQGTFKNSPCGTSSEKWWKSGSASLAFGSRFCIEIHINLKKYNTRKYL